MATDPALQQAKALKSIHTSIARAQANNFQLPAEQQSYADTGNQNVIQQIINPLSNIVHTSGELLARPEQLTAHGLARLTGHANTPEAAASGMDILKDLTGKTNINTRQALGMSANAGGLGGKVADFAGSVLLDPLTYLTFGTGAAGRIGLKVLGDTVSKEAASRVATKGIGSLTGAERGVFEAGLKRFGGSDKFVNKTLGVLQKPTTLKVGIGPGKVSVPGSARAVQGAKALAEKTGLASKARGLTAVGRAENKLGYVGGHQFLQTMNQSNAVGHALESNLSPLAKLAKSTNLTPLEHQTITRHLESGTVPAGLAELKAAGQENAAKVLEAADAVRHGIHQTQLEHGVSTPGNAAQYFPKTLTDAGKELVRSNPELAHFLGSKGGHLPNLDKLPYSTQRLNDLTEKQFGQRVVEENPIKALATHTLSVSHDAERKFQLNSLSKQVDTKGNPWIAQNPIDTAILKHGARSPEKVDAIKAAVTSDLAKKGYVERNLGDLGTQWVQKPLADHLEEWAKATDSKNLDSWQRFAQSWTNLWKGYATVPVLFGMGFHNRNLVGNVWNMFTNGFSDPRFLATGAKATIHIMKAQHAGENITQALKSLPLSPSEKKAVELAFKEGVVSSGFAHSELSPKGISATKSERLKTAINPLSAQNALIGGARPLAEVVENSSRLAMFLHEYEKTGSAAAASNAVRESLFNYNELTPADKVARQFAPFWTWNSRNIPAQARSIVRYPGRTATAGLAQVTQETNGPDTGGVPLPKYALEAGQLPITGGATPILGNLQLPTQAAGTMLQPLLQLPALGNKNLAPEGGLSEVLQNALANVGGGPTSALQGLMEGAAGTNARTGIPLKTNSAVAKNLLSDLIPQFGKEAGMQRLLTGSDANKATRVAALLRGLGLSVTPVTEKRISGEEIRRSTQLGHTLNMAGVKPTSSKGLASVKGIKKAHQVRVSGGATARKATRSNLAATVRLAKARAQFPRP